MTEKNQNPEQLSLFPEPDPSPAPATQGAAADLTTASSLSRAMDAFEKYMQERGFTENTQQAFRLDMQILADYLGPAQAIGEISPATLKAFLKWMDSERGVPCSPKTMERRITTLKVFFGWLAEEEVLPRDAAAPLIHQAVSAPLPDTLSEEQIQAVLSVTRSRRTGSETQKPDARPHLLVTLILNTGIKKGECVNLHLNHLDLTDPQHPALWVRYKRASRRHKERRIALPASWTGTLKDYLEQYPSKQFLFPWSARNLEYVLTGVAEEAGVPRLTFEMMRWTCAVRDHIAGMKPDTLRQKLGLSEISWYEVEVKLALLAQRRKKIIAVD